LDPGVVKIEKSCDFQRKNVKKRDFRNKNAQKMGENISCQQQTLLLDKIHWFMHKNQV
jgi:hypothetical protein